MEHSTNVLLMFVMWDLYTLIFTTIGGAATKIPNNPHLRHLLIANNLQRMLKIKDCCLLSLKLRQQGFALLVSMPAVPAGFPPTVKPHAQNH